jgi:hypothetical protein
VVKVSSQWPEDLQQQGVPAVLTTASHFDVMHTATTAKIIAKLVREKITRWSPDEVEKARKVLFAN